MAPIYYIAIKVDLLIGNLCNKTLVQATFKGKYILHIGALRNAAKIGSVRPVVTLRKEQTLILLDPFQRRGRVYKRKFCLSVYLSVIIFSFSKYFPPFLSLFFFSYIDQIFSSFSFSVFLLLHGPNNFLFQVPCSFSISLARGRVWPCVFLFVHYNILPKIVHVLLHPFPITYIWVHHCIVRPIVWGKGRRSFILPLVHILYESCWFSRAFWQTWISSQDL